MAIAECHRLDEVKDLRDKAMALALYARQASNIDAERKACEIRLRAERRAGELLKELARGEPGRPEKAATRAPISPYRSALESAQIAERAAQRYQAVANIPADIFEAALCDPDKPTTAGVLAKVEAWRTVQEVRDPVPELPTDVLWLWGRMRDLERDGYFNKDAKALLGPMSATMLADMQRILPLCVDFIGSLDKAAVAADEASESTKVGDEPSPPDIDAHAKLIARKVVSAIDDLALVGRSRFDLHRLKQLLSHEDWQRLGDTFRECPRHIKQLRGVWAYCDMEIFGAPVGETLPAEAAASETPITPAGRPQHDRA
jgi:hypothetical protein